VTPSQYADDVSICRRPLDLVLFSGAEPPSARTCATLNVATDGFSMPWTLKVHCGIHSVAIEPPQFGLKRPGTFERLDHLFLIVREFPGLAIPRLRMTVS
jgi:hypothetical protein